MNINEFLKKFLPDYEAKKQAYHPDEEFYTGVTFKDKHFPEALQNFADRICEAQKRKCGDAIMDSEYGYWIRDCENADQPEIDEL
jgi:hypothetical protein